MKQTPRVADRVEKPEALRPVEKRVPAQTEPEKLSWQFYFLMIVIALGIIGLIGKVLGLF